MKSKVRGQTAPFLNIACRRSLLCQSTTVGTIAITRRVKMEMI
jgi:hypothetical protein